MLASSELADTDSDVFSVIISNITRVGNSFEATVYVSLVTPQDQPGSEQVARIRESLTSELRQTQYILSANDLIRVGKCKYRYKNLVNPPMFAFHFFKCHSQLLLIRSKL